MYTFNNTLIDAAKKVFTIHSRATQIKAKQSNKKDKQLNVIYTAIDIEMFFFLN